MRKGNATHLIKTAFRRKANYWAALAVEIAASPFSRRKSPSGFSAAVRSWKRGLLIGADHIGDILYRTGSLPELARATPGCAWSWMSARPASTLLQTNPFLHQTIELEEDFDRIGLIPLSRRIRAGNFDVAICYDTGSYLRALLAAALAGVPVRVGYVHKGFSCLVTHPLQCSYPSPFAHYFRDLVAQIAGEAPSGEGRSLVYPLAEDERAADAFLQRLNDSRPLLACSFFTRQPHGGFPLDLFLETVRLVREEVEVLPVLIGSREERDRLEAAGRRLGSDCAIIAGDLELRALYALLRHCAAAFTPDSGIRHLANAAAIPVVFPRNPYSDPVETGFYCRNETDVGPASENPAPSAVKAQGISFDPIRAARAIVASLGAASP